MEKSANLIDSTSKVKPRSELPPVKKFLIPAAPIVGLLTLIATYVIVLNGNITSFHIQIILNQSVILATIATGAVFIFSIGGFDISLGASMAVSAMMGAVTYNNTESIVLTFLACVLIGVAIGTMNAIFSAVLNLPAFVSTIAMLSVLTAFMNIILAGNSTIVISSSRISQLDTVWMKLLILGTFFALADYLFNKTAIGRRNKFLGSNQLAASQTGISVVKQTFISFVFVGFGVGLSAILTLMRVSTLSLATGASIGMDVLVAIVFGGMPVSGGAKSKISASIIGATSITLLNQVLMIMGASHGATQLIKGFIFLAVVYVATSNTRTKFLNR